MGRHLWRTQTSVCVCSHAPGKQSLAPASPGPQPLTYILQGSCIYPINSWTLELNPVSTWASKGLSVNVSNDSRTKGRHNSHYPSLGHLLPCASEHCVSINMPQSVTEQNLLHTARDKYVQGAWPEGPQAPENTPPSPCILHWSTFSVCPVGRNGLWICSSSLLTIWEI